MMVAWEAVWDQINEEFVRTAEQLSRTNPVMWWSCGHLENEIFPFTAYASFGGSGVPGEEDFVISLCFKNVDGRLVFSSDVALGDGQIVSEAQVPMRRRASTVPPGWSRKYAPAWRLSGANWRPCKSCWHQVRDDRLGKYSEILSVGNEGSNYYDIM